jgi:hypothetical protein
LNKRELRIIDFSAQNNLSSNIWLNKLTSTSFSDLDGSINLDGNFFSTPSTTPSFVLIPIAVDPNFNQVLMSF